MIRSIIKLEGQFDFLFNIEENHEKTELETWNYGIL